jgi:hypothetical protein
MAGDCSHPSGYGRDLGPQSDLPLTTFATEEKRAKPAQRCNQPRLKPKSALLRNVFIQSTIKTIAVTRLNYLKTIYEVSVEQRITETYVTI